MSTATCPGTAERIRTTLIFYDYAGQDPINKYDLKGTYCSEGEFQHWLQPGSLGTSDCANLNSAYQACMKSSSKGTTTDANPTHGCYAVAAKKYEQATGHSPIKPSPTRVQEGSGAKCLIGAVGGGAAYGLGLRIAIKAADFDPLTAAFSAAFGCAFNVMTG